MSERITKAYRQNILSMQQMVTRYLCRLEQLSAKHYEEDEALSAQWNRQFGAKETPLTVLQKLVAMQKTTYELLQKAQAAEEGAPQPQKALKEVDWQILEMALEQRKAEKPR